MQLTAEHADLVRWLGAGIREAWDDESEVPEDPFIPQRSLQAQCTARGLDYRTTAALLSAWGFIQSVPDEVHNQPAPVFFATNRVLAQVYEWDLSDEAPAPNAPAVGGPLLPKSFIWDGKEHPGLTPTACRLLDHLWAKPNRRDHFDNLAEPVWKDHAIHLTVDQVKSASKEANRFFKSNGIPFKLSISTPDRMATLYATN